VPKVLAFGLILCFCFEPSALAANCKNDQLKVVKSSSPHYKKGSCLRKGKIFALDAGQCVLLEYKNGLQEKKCGKYSDKEKIDKGITGFIEYLIGKLKLHAVAVEENNNCILKIGSKQELGLCIITSQIKLFFERTDTNRVDILTIKDKDNKNLYTYKWQLGEKSFQLPLDQFPIQAGTNYRIINQAGNSWKFSFLEETTPGGICKPKSDKGIRSMSSVKSLPPSQN